MVGTPIGNLEDLSERARRVLGQVDVVAAEDTRRTGRLLAVIGVRSRLLSFFEANEARRVPEIVRLLREGSDVALVTDAGMPGISDPGYRLVAACVDGGVPVDVVPGPSAVVAALAVSGLPTDRFAFEGFLPRAGRARSDRLQGIAGEARTVVLFESPRRVARTLQDLVGLGVDRRMVLARELTKLHQEIIRGLVGEVLEAVRGRDLKGEVVLVLEGSRGGGASSGAAEDAVRMARAWVADGARKRDAAKRAAAAVGVPASAVYDALVQGAGPEGQGTAGSRRSATGRRAASSE